MMTRSCLCLFVSLFLLSSCSHKEDSNVVLSQSPLEKNGKIASFKNKLQKAEKSLESAEGIVARCKDTLYKEELGVIRKYVASCEKAVAKVSLHPQKYTLVFQTEFSDLFLKEREMLLTIMRSENSSLAKEAGELLDHILHLITQLSTKRSE